ncbi:MAG: hypothetical protein QXS38_02170 [Candidatus Pacearchaeota archaeon]
MTIIDGINAPQNLINGSFSIPIIKNNDIISGNKGNLILLIAENPFPANAFAADIYSASSHHNGWFFVSQK